MHLNGETFYNVILSERAVGLKFNDSEKKYVYWYMKQISGERLQDHWSSGFASCYYILAMKISKRKVPAVLSKYRTFR